MARVTVEDCVINMNKFDLVLFSAKRARNIAIDKKDRQYTDIDHMETKETVLALREFIVNLHQYDTED